MKIKTVSTFYARMKGLLGTNYCQLDFDALHLLPCKGVHTYGMNYPLDIAFLDRRKVVLSTQRCVEPNRLCASPRGTHSVVERPTSPLPWLKAGDRLSFDAGEIAAIYYADQSEN
ncbi:MAG: DUF192 domain-containing protein [Coriobacteriia bacterium]|nr:DUF192 domain-containing protein [Coriobacteriia bacterium]